MSCFSSAPRCLSTDEEINQTVGFDRLTVPEPRCLEELLFLFLRSRYSGARAKGSETPGFLGSGCQVDHDADNCIAIRDIVYHGPRKILVICSDIGGLPRGSSLRDMASGYFGKHVT
ncbi:hypothetical protein LX36DRAFT_176281 [Colletotrichum falcatum]|nr:hypothetical protein LX36DRAFT_176281 [Colletotrichum falcatum]